MVSVTNHHFTNYSWLLRVFRRVRRVRGTIFYLNRTGACSLWGDLFRRSGFYAWWGCCFAEALLVPPSRQRLLARLVWPSTCYAAFCGLSPWPCLIFLPFVFL